VVLATGGAGAIYLRNDNQKSTMGQGYALAAQAGLELWDMEFIQFYPFVFEEPGLPQFMVYTPYPKEVKLINASGEDILKKHGLDSLNDAVRKMRDAMSVLIYSERRSGPVLMDFREVPEDRWRDYPMTFLKKLKFDTKKNPFRVSPGVHYFMGGARIEEDGQSKIKGLFACGEAVWGMHGANRRGGNALSECVVFGQISGRNAGRHAKTNRKERYKYTKEKEISAKHESAEDLRMFRQQIREIAWYHAGILRTEDSIKEGIIKLSTLLKRLEKVSPKTVIEKRLKFDLLSATLVLKGILAASKGRRESRGAFMREDFPDTDDTSWRKNSCIRYDNETGEFEVKYHPVVEMTVNNDV
jgi:succinate dehydrogenase/fumarate reductase flavoprotein subunit